MNATRLLIIKTAKILGKQVHVGRVNTYKRYRRFSVLGCDTCVGSGVSRYDNMLQNILNGLRAENCSYPLFEEERDGTDRNTG